MAKHGVIHKTGSTYYIVFIRGPSHGHNWHLQKISWSLDVWFFRYASGQTDIQTHRHARCNTSPHREAK